VRRPLPHGPAHVASLQAALERVGPHLATAERWGVHLADVLPRGGRLLATGNGGSAAQAQHLTAEFVGRYRDDRAPYAAVCLSAETSTLTAIVNDYPPEELFARQVQAHARPGDVLVLFSTSGRSPNVVAAAERGDAAGATVWAVTGPAPNPLVAAAAEAITIDSPHTATVQEVSLVVLHLVCVAFDRAVGAGVGPGGAVGAAVGAGLEARLGSGLEHGLGSALDLEASFAEPASPARSA
jgi:D-sedoheptulose 7-phosphate isomerase